MGIENNIDWVRLITAISFYSCKGYHYTNLDWTVDRKISEITKPIDRRDYFIEDKSLVASGEQSFLQLIVDNKLSNGRYCGITPCFRDEDAVDELHQRYFMKVELINTLDVNKESLNKMIDCAYELYSKYLNIEVIEVGDQLYDIVDSKNKIELGSYGIRHYENIHWVFGTGLAEPRLSKVINIA